MTECRIRARVLAKIGKLRPESGQGWQTARTFGIRTGEAEQRLTIRFVEYEQFTWRALT